MLLITSIFAVIFIYFRPFYTNSDAISKIANLFVKPQQNYHYFDKIYPKNQSTTVVESRCHKFPAKQNFDDKFLSTLADLDLVEVSERFTTALDVNQVFFIEKKYFSLTKMCKF